VIGWIAAELTPPAPPPQADLKVDYNPVTATLAVLRKAFANPNVLRPLLGVAWFYGLSTVFVTTFPDYVASVMGYEEGVLMIMLASSTIAILVGSLLTLVIGDWKIWGSESVGLAALGISGVTLCVLLLYLLPSPTYAGAETFGPASDFLANPDTPRFMATIIGASICNGLFLVPLQAMAQRRSNPNIRAQLMSAGSVLLNLFVNITTFGLIALAAREVSPKMPFLMIAIGFRHPTNCVYVLGPEKGNLSDEMQDRCDYLVKIPTKFCINVSLACALALYDRTIMMGGYPERPVKVGGPEEGWVKPKSKR